MFWILDGYNIILADEKLSRIARNSLERAREELMQVILSSGRTFRESFVLVFDGKSAGSTQKVAGKLEVRFTRSRETADDLIKSLVGSQHRRRSTCVVSNDLSIVRFVKECGAKAIGSRDFLSMIRARREDKRTIEPAKEKPSPTSKVDTALLRLFREKRDEV